MAAAASGLPDGYRVTVSEGYNPVGHVPNSQHHISGRGALDLQIWDAKGNPISNKGADKSGMYKLLAQNAYGYMLDNYPELKGKLAWGGSFGTGRGSRVPDLMHFDIGGERGDLMPHLSKLGRPSGNPIAYSPTAGGAASAAADMAASQPSRTLRKGATDASSNGAVSRLQQQLADGGFYKGKIDGDYGPRTAAAVKAAEAAYGLPQERRFGVAGPQVQGALDSIGRTHDITSAVNVGHPGGFPDATPDRTPLDIAFGRTGMPWDVPGGRTGFEGSPELAGGSSAPSLGPNLDPALYNPALPDLMGGGRATADQMFAPPDSYTQAQIERSGAPPQAPWNALAGARMPLPPPSMSAVADTGTPTRQDITPYAPGGAIRGQSTFPDNGTKARSIPGTPTAAQDITDSFFYQPPGFSQSQDPNRFGPNLAALSAPAEPYFGDQLSDAIGNGVSTVWNGIGSGISGGLDAIRRGAVNAGLALPETMGISPATATSRSPTIFDRTPSAIHDPTQAPNDMTPWGPGFGQQGNGGGGGQEQYASAAVNPNGFDPGPYSSKPLNPELVRIIDSMPKQRAEPPMGFAGFKTGAPQDEWSTGSDFNTLPPRYYDTQQYYLPSYSPKDINPAYENMWRQEELSFPRSVNAGSDFNLPLASPMSSSRQSSGIPQDGMLYHQQALSELPKRYYDPSYIPFPSGGKLGAYASIGSDMSAPGRVDAAFGPAGGPSPLGTTSIVPNSAGYVTFDQSLAKPFAWGPGPTGPDLSVSSAGSRETQARRASDALHELSAGTYGGAPRSGAPTAPWTSTSGAPPYGGSYGQSSGGRGGVWNSSYGAWSPSGWTPGGTPYNNNVGTSVDAWANPVRVGVYTMNGQTHEYTY